MRDKGGFSPDWDVVEWNQMRRTDLLDTSLEMHRLQIKLLREKGPEWRIRRAFELTEELRALRRRTEASRPKHLREALS